MELQVETVKYFKDIEEIAHKRIPERNDWSWLIQELILMIIRIVFETESMIYKMIWIIINLEPGT